MIDYSNIYCIILAAGNGTRMKSKIHKIMHKIGGIPLIGHVLNLCKNKFKSNNIIVIIDPNEKSVPKYIKKNSKAKIYFQTNKLGTGHAVLMAKNEIITAIKKNSESIILVLYADTPFVKIATLNLLIKKILLDNDIAILGFKSTNFSQYGRILTNDNGKILAIKEFKDLSDNERKITLCNSGIMVFKAKYLIKILEKINNKNLSREYYLTNSIKIANTIGLNTSMVICDKAETLGINNRAQLAKAEIIYQNILRKNIMCNGVTLIDPSSVFLSAHVKIGIDVTIEPNVIINGYVTIKNGVNILAFSYIKATKENPIIIGENSNIGPYAYLREGSKLKQNCKIGNFVEIKKTIIEDNTKINHLSYIGDSVIGKNSNIGAGTITCNYNGFKKFKTIIGKNTFIGSNSSLIAPINIANGSYIGSGSVITKNISEDSLAFTRTKQIEIKQWTKKFKQKNNK